MEAMDTEAASTELPILEVEGLSKRYRLGRQGRGSMVQEALGGLWRLLGRKKEADTSFLALEDVSFQVRRGEILGIVGRNGAGKSTLLRILSEVTPPTAGRVVYRGKVTSILDVGTGFHPDLSGRQNVYMSAALLGANRQMIDARFESIMAFSGLERFIDMPVKHYSSGMYMRLAFAVAFHSQSDILLLDEVLSVGDVEFRHKSTQKIKEIAASGTTVLIVSHELTSVRNLCTTCMILEAGKVRAHGPTQAILDQYLAQYYDEAVFVYRSPDQPDKALSERTLRHEVVDFESIEVKAAGKLPSDPIYMSDAVEVLIRFHKKESHRAMEVLLNVNNLENLILSDSRIYREGFEMSPLPTGHYSLKTTIPCDLLYLGSFYIDLIFGDIQSLYLELPCIHRFTVHLNPWEVGKPWNMGHQYYALRPKLLWELTVDS